MIKEIIVVEGKDDVAAVKKAVDAEIITTSGFGFPDDLIDRIRFAQERRGVIVFTDPDYAGEKIRKLISKEVKNLKHAFLPRDKATKDDNIGIENAKKEDIIEALNNARVESTLARDEFSKKDLIKNRLVGSKNASKNRDELGRILGIGYCNSKQFIKRLNNYGITRDEFNKAIGRIKNG
ncbi:MAG: ribonuclease M5 [Firmicutes bacterium]|nr:ribonuclease M5 [Bacillota bacterium]